MAVLIEGISVVIRVEAIAKSYEGGIATFKADVPNGTMCADGQLVRVGFMHPDDARTYVELLESRGLTWKAQHGVVDLVVCDQREGFLQQCEWASVGHTYLDGDPQRTIAVCLGQPDGNQKVFLPEGWTWETSLTHRHSFRPIEQAAQSAPDPNDPGLDVLEDQNGTRHFVGRTGKRQSPLQAFQGLFGKR